MGALRKGYDEAFLGDGITVPMPTVSLEWEDDVLHSDRLRDRFIADYIHYSVVMSQFNKQAFFSAANLDQEAYKSVSGRDWFVDPRIGLENQVGPKAYQNNPWDRGHLTRRSAVTWGSTYEAKRASNDSCSYANASMQHENFNQDEWRVPEKVVQYFDRDKNDKLCVFTGPVFTETDRWYLRRGQTEAVRIPSAFWKVVAYIGKESGSLECQAYVLYQDDRFLADKRGRHNIDIHNYQVTITEIEQMTGLEFPESLYNSNPLYFYPRKDINEGPEAFTAPAGTSEADLAIGVVFSRDDAESKAFADRKREMRLEDFEALMSAPKDL